MDRENISTVLSSRLVGDVDSIIFLSIWGLPSSNFGESVLQTLATLALRNGNNAMQNSTVAIESIPQPLPN